MRVVLLGDSHLARIRRGLPRIGENVVNAAVGGATVLDLEAQSGAASLSNSDALVVSVGTNDSASWNAIPVPDFHWALRRFIESHRLAATSSWRPLAWTKDDSVREAAPTTD